MRWRPAQVYLLAFDSGTCTTARCALAARRCSGWPKTLGRSTRKSALFPSLWRDPGAESTNKWFWSWTATNLVA